MTLKDFREKAQFSQKLLMAQHEAHEEKKAAFRKSCIGNLLQQKITSEDAEYSAAVAAEREKLHAELS